VIEVRYGQLRLGEIVLGRPAGSDFEPGILVSLGGRRLTCAEAILGADRISLAFEDEIVIPAGEAISIQLLW